MVREIYSETLTPLVLAHDGVLVMLPYQDFVEKYNSDVEKITNLFSLPENNKYSQWCHYLLQDFIPVEVKRLVVDGQHTEF